MGRVDIITGTLGKALGGASGGYTSGKRSNSVQEVLDYLTRSKEADFTKPEGTIYFVKNNDEDFPLQI